MLPSLAALKTGVKDARLGVIERVVDGDYTVTLNESARNSVEIVEEIKAVVNAEDFELTPTNLARLVQYASQLGDMAIVWNSVVARYTERGEGVYASVIFVAKTQIAVIERLRSRIRELADGVVETPPEAVP